MARCVSIGWFALLSFLVLSVAAAAHERPSLAELSEAICEHADAAGATHRPKVCDPRCTCDDGVVPLGGYGSCSETSPGVVEIDLLEATGPCIERVHVNNVPEIDCIGGACSTAADCPPGFGCVFNLFLGSSECFGPVGDPGCGTPSKCTVGSGTTCAANWECPAGELCVWEYSDVSSGNPSGYCGQYCAVDADCAIARTLTLTGVAGHDAASAVSCTLDGAELGLTGANDALACIADAEAALAVDCAVICGDGNLDAGEQCDDGNLDAGDGCAPDCTTE